MKGTEELSPRFSSCNLVCDLSNFQKHYVYFTETCRNVIVHGTFTKIQYSDSMISFHGIYLYFSLKLDPKSAPSALSLVHVESTQRMDTQRMGCFAESDTDLQKSYAVNRYQVYYLPTCPVNYNVIKELNQVEYNIMEHYKQFKGNIHKQNVYSLRNQLRTGSIRVYGQRASVVPSPCSLRTGTEGPPIQLNPKSAQRMKGRSESCREIEEDSKAIAPEGGYPSAYSQGRSPIVQGWDLRLRSNPTEATRRNMVRLEPTKWVPSCFADSEDFGNSQRGSLTTDPDPNTHFVLKISGIWETATHVGITYKFMDIGRPITMQT